MINISIVCVGSIKDKNMECIILEYAKRLQKYCKLQIVEVKDESLSNAVTISSETSIKEKEASKILPFILDKKNTYIFALDENGKEYSSIALAKKLEDLPVRGYSNLVFVIGGSLGLSNTIINCANEQLSFSKLTFPHQLIRVFLLEQLFRCYKITSGETYHH